MEEGKLKNTKEVITFLLTLVIFFFNEAKKDGLQLKDLTDLVMKPDFLNAILDALEGADKISAELKNLSFADGLDLGRFLYKNVFKTIEVLGNAHTD